MIPKETIQDLTSEELTLLIYIVRDLLPSGPCEINKNTIRCFRYPVLEKKLHKAKNKINSDEEAVETFNSMCQKLGLNIEAKKVEQSDKKEKKKSKPK